MLLTPKSGSKTRNQKDKMSTVRIMKTKHDLSLSIYNKDTILMTPIKLKPKSQSNDNEKDDTIELLSSSLSPLSIGITALNSPQLHVADFQDFSQSPSLKSASRSDDQFTDSRANDNDHNKIRVGRSSPTINSPRMVNDPKISKNSVRLDEIPSVNSKGTNRILSQASATC